MIPKKILANLASAANAEIDAILSKRPKTIAGKKKSEVDLLAAIAIMAPGQIAAAWKPILAPHKIQATIHGVFCHQVPKVLFKGPRGTSARCELADLLLVIDQYKTSKITNRRAILVQTKMASVKTRYNLTGKTSLGKKELVQLHLYKNWPSFVITSPGYDNKTSRNFTNKKIPGKYIDSGRYGIIDYHIPTKKSPRGRWFQVKPTSPPLLTTRAPELGEFIARMLTGSPTGYGRDVHTPSKNDWDVTINELMNVTYYRGFGLKSSFGNTRPQAGHSGVAYLVANTSHFIPSPISWSSIYNLPPIAAFLEGDAPQPMGILRIAISIDEKFTEADITEID